MRNRGLPIPPELLELRRQGHAVFDALWKRRLMDRESAYALLARLMGLTVEETHFSLFTAEQCRRAIGLLDGMDVPTRVERMKLAKCGRRARGDARIQRAGLRDAEDAEEMNAY